ncbi:MAG: glycoside hydrolase family 31 protein [Rudaea sp.]|uniref:glycoside hydrolase family 31 protein n=1 Tax=Rudaea sp. TaxID=2136325 RepID=UPI0039E40228
MKSKTTWALAGAMLLSSAVTQARAAWQTVGAVTQAVRSGETATFATANGARVEVGFLTPDVVRVRMSPGGKFGRDFSYALERGTPQSVKLRFDDDAERGELRAETGDGARVVVQKRPVLSITVYDAQGRIVVADDPARPMAFDAATGAVEASEQRGAYELYYGFGEQATPTISREGQFLVNWNTDSYKYPVGTNPLYQTIPFFIALRDGLSYGVFFDNTWRSTFDMGKSDPRRYAFGADGGELDYYVFTGGAERSPANVLRDYTALTGRTALPPLWALGYQQSRYSYLSQAKVEEIARTFREKKIPADVIHLDIDHMDGYRVFTWNPQTFAEPEKMLAGLHRDGFHAVTIVDPGVKFDENYAVYRSGRDAGVYVRDAAGGELHEKVWPGLCAFPDFTDPKARAWWGEQYKKPLAEGVDGFWNDMDEPAIFTPDGFNGPQPPQGPQKTFALDVRHAGDGDPGTHARYHNVFGMQMVRATFEGLRKLAPERRPFAITRAGYAGVQRYAAVWSGDNDASWDHLALTIPLLTNLSISGVSFVGADVGGFAATTTPELYTRWMQAAALTPFYRTHSANDTDAREPWTYGGEYERINRASIELRYRLLPYLYTLFAQNEQSGLPPLRPLWFDYSRDVDALLIADEYLVGRDLLVAPVVIQNQRSRTVYFPKGDAWIDWWSGVRYEGGKTARIDAPLARLPLFVRAGAGIPTQPVVQNTGEMKNVPLTIAVAAGASGSSEIYQDAGDGYAYRNGASRTIKIVASIDKVTLDIPKSGAYQRVAAVELLGLDAAPSALKIDGKVVRDAAFDAATRRLRISLPNENIREISFAH